MPHNPVNPVNPSLIILASRSPERARLLQQLVPEFDVREAEIDESPHPGEKIEDLVVRLASEKAICIYRNTPAIIIAADTMIECDGKGLGKPQNIEDAEDMMQKCSGRSFAVYTGMALIQEGSETLSFLSKNLVWMKTWQNSQLRKYLAEGKWKNCAGGFSIADNDSPVQLLEGSVESVRGLDLQWLAGGLYPA